jgi:hypothetical protein
MGFGVGVMFLLIASAQVAYSYLLDRSISGQSFKFMIVGELLLLFAVLSGEILFNMEGLSKAFKDKFMMHELLGLVMLMEYAFFIIWFMLRTGQMGKTEKKLYGIFNLLACLFVISYISQLFF